MLYNEPSPLEVKVLSRRFGMPNSASIDAYLATDPDYDGHVSVPLLWDKATGRIVSNNFPDISLDLGTQFEAWADRKILR